MFPWMWFWNPSFNFPFSGAVSQDIRPETFFGAIPKSAGDGNLEQEIFELHSYGTQLDALMEAVLAMAGDDPQKRVKALGELRQMAKNIEDLKARYRDVRR